MCPSWTPAWARHPSSFRLYGSFQIRINGSLSPPHGHREQTLLGRQRETQTVPNLLRRSNFFGPLKYDLRVDLLTTKSFFLPVQKVVKRFYVRRANMSVSQICALVCWCTHLPTGREHREREWGWFTSHPLLYSPPVVFSISIGWSGGRSDGRNRNRNRNQVGSVYCILQAL